MIGFDTETTIVELDKEVPEMVLMTASSEDRHVVVSPEQLEHFVLNHADRTWLGFNVKFDWWVVRKALLKQQQHRVVFEWHKMLESGNLKDLMIQDFLTRLAWGISDDVLRFRNLDQVARSYTNRRLDKDDPYRMRFNELIDKDWTKPEYRPWFDYAVLDTAVLIPIYREIQSKIDEMGGPDNQWGRLTDQLQLKADIVLSAIGRKGMLIDQDKLNDAQQRLSKQVSDRVVDLQGFDKDLFSYYKEKKRRGQLKRNAKTGVPNLTHAVLRDQLTNVAARQGLDLDTLPRTAKTGALSTSLPLWSMMAPEDPFIEAWTEMANSAKLLQFIAQLQGQREPEVHPQYTVLVRTGRTSARNPNIQQMPRESWFRELFIARPGHTFVIADYSAIELVTLAAVLEDRFGHSELARVIREGLDPHTYTASIVLGRDYERLLQRLAAEDTEAKNARQRAKAINFGVPGGLGAKKLAQYARANYNVDMTDKEAGLLRRMLTREVYPEIGEYLTDGDRVPRLARVLQADEAEVRKWAEANSGRLFGAERVLAGLPATDGKAYTASSSRNIFDSLRHLNRNPELIIPLREERPSRRLASRLFGRGVWTLTGRCRGNCTYTEEHNTPFQGLAADGAKNALWNLWRHGLGLVAFIHDEVVVEVPEDLADKSAQTISKIMSESMQEVLHPIEIPVKVEYKISPFWTK